MSSQRAHYFKLGLKYASGQGVPKDEGKAVKYYTLAAEQGLKEAQYNLGLMYENGQGVKKNNKEAARYFTLAAEQGHKDAQYSLGLMYAYGRGVRKNEERAVKYFTLAAVRGHVESAQHLNIIYSGGYGSVEQNAGKARHFHQLATTVDEHDAFRQFASSTKKSNALLQAPSLLLRVFEQTTTGVSEQGLYKHVLSPDVELSKSYIPSDPPFAKPQRGPTCGLYALETGLAWGYPDPKLAVPPARKNPVKPTKAEKEKNKDTVSLRERSKKLGSAMGEIFDIDNLKELAKQSEFECDTIKTKDKDRKNYTKQIRKAIKAGNSVVVPVDIDGGFPGNMQGKGTHYALAWGYIYKDNQYHFLVTHYGRHYLWSADALQKSHEQLPDINTRDLEYYKNHENDSYDPIKGDMDVPANDRRVLPQSDLKNFKFTALTIPTTNRNFLLLDAKTMDSRGVSDAVKSSDAIQLKLLAETGVTLKPAPKLEGSLEEKKNVPLEIQNSVRSSVYTLGGMASAWRGILNDLKHIQVTRHDGLSNLKDFATSNISDKNDDLFYKQVAKIVNECDYRSTSLYRIISRARLISKNEPLHNEYVSLLYRAIAQSKENIVFDSRIRNLEQLINIQQRREVLKEIDEEIESSKNKGAYKELRKIILSSNVSKSIHDILADTTNVKIKAILSVLNKSGSFFETSSKAKLDKFNSLPKPHDLSHWLQSPPALQGQRLSL